MMENTRKMGQCFEMRILGVCFGPAIFHVFLEDLKVNTLIKKGNMFLKEFEIRNVLQSGMWPVN